MKVLGLAYHVGSGNGVATSIQALTHAGDPTLSVVQDDSLAGAVFRRYGLPYQILDNSAPERNLREIYDAFDPDVVLVGPSNQQNLGEFVIEQAVTKISRVPVVCVFDLPGNYSMRWSTQGTNDLRYLPNYIAVFNPLAKDEMVEEGIPVELIRVTGNPYFDTLSSNRPSLEAITHLREEMAIKPKDLVILYGSNYLRRAYSGTENRTRENTEEFRHYLREIEENCKREIGYSELDTLDEVVNLSLQMDTYEGRPVRGFVTLHPREIKEGDIVDLEQRTSSTSLRYVRARSMDDVKRISISTLLAASDVYITSFSTTMLETLLTDPAKPIISVQPDALKRAREDLEFTVRAGICPVVYERGELARVFKDVMHEKAENRAARVRQALRTDGKAAERVVALVHDVGRNG